MAENRILKVTSGASSKGEIHLFELTGNGSNKVILTAPDSVTSDATVTAPSATSTLATTNLAETFSGAKTFSGAVTLSNTLTSSGGSLSGTFSGNPTFSGTVTLTTVAGNPTFTGNVSGNGIVPVGGVIAVMDNMTGAWTVPASGTVSDGWQYCDGAAVAGSQTITGTMPDLTDDRFLMGDTVSGVTGGSNTHTSAGTLSGTQSIQHTHTVNSHSHEMHHYHKVAEWNSSNVSPNSNLIFNNTATTGAGTFNDGVIGYSTLNLSAGSFPFDVMQRTESSSNKTLYSSGAYGTPLNTLSTARTSAESTTTGLMSANNSVDFSNATYTGSSLESRPKYLTCKYVMRVS